MKDIVSSLIGLADRLDAKGHHKLANEVDQIILKVSKVSLEKTDETDKKPHMSHFKDLGKVSVEIPENEYNNLQNTFKILSDSLKERVEQPEEE